MGGEGQSRTGGGILYFPAPGCWDVGSCKITIFAWWGCSASWFNFLCRTCSFHGGRGGKKGRQLYFQNKGEVWSQPDGLYGPSNDKKLFSYFHITLKVTSKIHKFACVCVFASPLACDFTASKPTCTQKPLVHIAGNHSTGFFPMR